MYCTGDLYLLLRYDKIVIQMRLMVKIYSIIIGKMYFFYNPSDDSRISPLFTGEGFVFVPLYPIPI